MHHFCETFVTHPVVTCPAAPFARGFMTQRLIVRLFWVLTHIVINKLSSEKELNTKK